MLFGDSCDAGALPRCSFLPHVSDETADEKIVADLPIALAVESYYTLDSLIPPLDCYLLANII